MIFFSFIFLKFDIDVDDDDGSHLKRSHGNKNYVIAVRNV